ncbi:hypothetical protein E2C01_003619 [Portunus trituberculatus]|uniref:Secreted protein n=1 Tax=Portunus trituberculatus TaxID=210409 RepID=A0A5B7CU17_PORTR|nr:hypothetical protein [Portunus trituberculatus]
MKMVMMTQLPTFCCCIVSIICCVWARLVSRLLSSPSTCDARDSNSRTNILTKGLINCDVSQEDC